MTAHGPVNLFIPRATLTSLSIPELSVTDGTNSPEWVNFRCIDGWQYARRTLVRLPVDADTAAIAHRWNRFRHWEGTLIRPIFLTLAVSSLAVVYFADAYTATVLIEQLVLILAAYGVLWSAKKADEHLTLRSHPETLGRSGVYVPAVPESVAREWTSRNPDVRVVEEIPVSGLPPITKILVLTVIGIAISVNLLPDATLGQIIATAISLSAIAVGFTVASRLPANLRRSRSS